MNTENSWKTMNGKETYKKAPMYLEKAINRETK